jgi:hypothetical protein
MPRSSKVVLLYSTAISRSASNTAGLLRCRRCGRKLTIRRAGANRDIPRHSCRRGLLDNGEPRCIAFGGLRVDDAIEEALMRDLEAARHHADRAFRQYDAAETANRLVAADPEMRWNRAPKQAADADARITTHDATASGPSSLAVLDAAMLAGSHRAIWGAPASDARSKKRLVGVVIHEVVADIDDETSEIVVLIHWVGGARTGLRLPKRRRGQRNSTAFEIIDAVRHLALIASDDLIAGTLDRSGLLTGHGNRWTRERVTALRSHHGIPVFRPAPDGTEPWLALTDAARLIGVSPKTLTIAAEAGAVDSNHPLSDGSWLFRRSELATPQAQQVADQARQREKHPARPHPDRKNPFPSTTERDGCYATSSFMWVYTGRWDLRWSEVSQARAQARSRSAVWMNLSALALALGVHGLVRMCLRIRSRQAAANANDLWHGPLSIMTLVTLMPRL